MAGKFKSTGFARFFMFLIIAAPLIYSGVAVFNGENPLESIKRDLGIETTVSNESAPAPDSNSNNSELADLENELRKLKDENRDLVEKLKNCQ